jgi:hypothetical protein
LAVDGWLAGLWNYLARWVESPERRWNICARVKGGLRDTSKLGGFCRDQAYWAGAVRVLRSRAQLDFPLLLSGRINIDEALPSCSDPPPSLECAILPSFLADVDTYRRKLDDLAVANFID